ncbi:N-acetylmuramoyl-L-alanine amidase [Streptococcus mitis]|jgi:Negative regulator of beta-lactamase expression
MFATKRVNGDLFSGLITDVDEEIMNSDQNRLDIDTIVIHHNGGLSDEGARSTWYVSTGHGTSAHYQVTPDKIWGCVGEESVAYHAGNYEVNQRSIGIEHLNNRGEPDWTIAEETYRNSARLIADICNRYNLPINRETIHPHQEFTATDCPGGIDIDRLIQMVLELSGDIDNEEQVKQFSESDQVFLVRVVNDDLYLRTGPGVDYPDDGFCPLGTFTIIQVEEADGYTWGLLKSGRGWIALDYTEEFK